MGTDLLQTYDEQYAAARARVAEALSEADDRPSGVLLRWILDRGVNPYEVFSRHRDACQIRSAEEAASLLHRIDRAVEDGEVCFPETESHGPYVHLGSSALDPETPEIFLAEIRANGHGENVIDGHRVTGFCEDLDAFIATFEAWEKKYAEMTHRLSDFLDAPEP